MTLHDHPVPPVPDATAAAMRAAFPKGNLYVTVREELGTLFTDAPFASWFAPLGRPVEVAPWRLALVLVLQHMETLTDRQAADNVRRCLDWKYLLSLELTDPGFDFTLLHDFRERLLDNQADQQLLDTLLDAFKARGLLKARGKQRTDATHVLANVRTLNRLECVGETLRHTLEVLATVAPDWLVRQVDASWFERYATRFDAFHLPTTAAERTALANRIGQDGHTLLSALDTEMALVWLRALPAVVTLRQLWSQQYQLRDGQRHWRCDHDLPPAAEQIVSPYDTDARWSRKRSTTWTGYKVHLTESCDDDAPHLITHVATTAATTQDGKLTAVIHDDLAQRDLLPAEHLVDSAYVAAEELVVARSSYGLELVGPVAGDTSWQARAGKGYDVGCFVVDWEGRSVTCPQGKRSTGWQERDDGRGQAVVAVEFAPAACGACGVREACTKAVQGARTLKLRPKEQHMALQRARQAQNGDGFKQRYAKRAGVEGAMAQATGRFAARRTPYRGLAKTHLHHVLLAIAMNLTRLVAWLWDEQAPSLLPRSSRFVALAGRLC